MIAPATAPPAGETAPAFATIMLASEGRPIPDAAIEFVAGLAASSGARVHILSIARVHGVAFGMPNPGLLPTKTEWDERRRSVSRAVKRLRRKGVSADGQVLGTRRAAKRICEEAARHGCEAIVMAADPDRNRVVADLLWTQEPQRVRRRAKVPVFLVPDDARA